MGTLAMLAVIRASLLDSSKDKRRTKWIRWFRIQGIISLTSAGVNVEPVDAKINSTVVQTSGIKLEPEKTGSCRKLSMIDEIYDFRYWNQELVMLKIPSKQELCAYLRQICCWWTQSWDFD